MAGFASVAQLVDAELAGQSHYATFRKSPSQVTTTRVWFDLSMSPGNPTPQYYAATPLEATALARSTDGGLHHGGNVSGATKVVKRLTLLATVATALPMPVILADYLMFYPFIDEGSTDPQPLTNDVTLPRWTDGEGVQIMAVSVAGRTGGQTFQCTYTNSDGVAGRLTTPVIENTAGANGHIVSTDGANASAAGPFLPLQAGDTGVRSIESVQMISGADVGLFALVLVKPLLTTQIRGIDAVVETTPIIDQAGTLPVVADDAYLNLLCLPLGSLAATAIHGDITVVWN
jgi:hypothetical protein